MLTRGEARGEDINIEDAEILVGGGRGLGEKDNFSLAEDLAKSLGGAVAATRAVVDAGGTVLDAIGQTARRSREDCISRSASPERSSTRSDAVSEPILAINKKKRRSSSSATSGGRDLHKHDEADRAINAKKGS